MVDYRKRLIEMHRRAQRAEGLLMKLVEAHDTGTRYAEKHKGIGCHMYGCFVMGFYKSLWKKAKVHISKEGD